MRKKVLILIALILAFANSGAIMIQQNANAKVEKPPKEEIVKVAFCHRTDSASNPYVLVDVDVNSVLTEGHGEHKGPIATSKELAESLKDEDGKPKWGDIIPGFDYGDGQHYEGYNNSPEGLAILENDCNFVESVKPVITHTDATCSSEEMNYTVKKVQGVNYYLGSVSNNNKITSYDAISVESGTTITIIAKAKKGYILDQSFVNPWVHTFTIPTEEYCAEVKTVTPARVRFVDATCETKAKYVIPEQEGVEYYVDGILQTAGKHIVKANSKIVVTAVAMEGYEFSLGAKYTWSHKFTIPTIEDCVQGETQVTPAAVTFVQPTCSALGSYTIPTTTGVNYLINEKVVAAGIYSGVTGSSIKVTAEPSAENYSIVKDAQTEWTNTFTAPTNCDDDGDVLGETTVKSLPNTSGTGMNPIASIAAFSIAIMALAGAAMKRFYMERL